MQVLVKEALVLSARLRLPESVPFEEVQASTLRCHAGSRLLSLMP